MKRVLLLICFCALAFACEKENTENGGGKDNRPATIVGTVKGDDGSLLKDVVVSDGLNCVKTDASGRYALPADLTKTRYVFVSTPAGWAAPVNAGSGMVEFWKFLSDYKVGADGKYDIPFTLEKITNPERYTVIIFADPQPRRNDLPTDQYAFKSLDCCEDMYDDMADLVKNMTDRPVYGIALGDIVHQDLSLLTEYKTGMARTGIRTYNIIGNHDHGHRLMADDQSSLEFEKQMGPVNYSFNLGGMHYLMLDDMISPDPSTQTYSDECGTGLTDEIWEWVKNDMALVPTSTPIMVCAHSPLFKTLSNNGNEVVIKDRSLTVNHIGDLRNLLSKYSKSYGWAGHTHATFNYVDKDDKVVEAHTLTRVTGALWSNDWQGSNGTPRGYVIFEYDNGRISWKFKPTYYQTGSYQYSKQPAYDYRPWTYKGGRAYLKNSDGTEGTVQLSDDYQMQLYAPGVYGDSYIYANIFMWDERWGTPIFTTKGVPSPMTRVSDKDKMFSYSNWELNNFYYKLRNPGLSVFKDEWTHGKNNCASMFCAFVNEPSGTGTVTVRDRFGNDYSSTITW